ncbi:hypothetical protein cyc_01906 [Cyclospora cayetanensis]|uniref:Uncharacterized protein n=1 Tax=Cyclospora cayetanensis TaxID=88456 RepID=A0A1D3CST1_9EIME|nr:hypothetical protein cyc_01906 [Cyclospora cayetanensis]
MVNLLYGAVIASVVASVGASGMQKETSKQVDARCCCTMHNRRCMLLSDIQFLLHVSEGAPAPPENTIPACCLQQREEQLQEQPHDSEAGDIGTEAEGPFERNKRLRVASAAEGKLQHEHPLSHRQRTSFASGGSSGTTRCNCCREAHERESKEPRSRKAPHSPCGQRFTPVFDSNSQRNLVSVNAGNPKLYVGGGTINQAFSTAINDWVQSKIDELQGPSDAKAAADREGEAASRQHSRWDPRRDLAVDWGTRMERVHNAAMEIARGSPFKVAALRCDGPAGKEGLWRTPFKAIYAMTPSTKEAAALKLKKGDAYVFLDFLRDELRPRDDKNVAMAYVVGPKAWEYSEKDFYHTLFVLSRNLLRLIILYNTKEVQIPEGLPLQQLRMPLVSGGAFLGNADPMGVASAIVKGFLAAVEEYRTNKEVPVDWTPPGEEEEVPSTPPPDLPQSHDSSGNTSSFEDEAPTEETFIIPEAPELQEGWFAAAFDPYSSSTDATSCCCCCKNNGVIPVIEFALANGDVFYSALIKEWHNSKN